MQHPWLKSYPADIDWHADIPAETLPALFARAAREYAGRPCLSFMGRTWTYAQAADMARRFARGLQDLGCGKGGTVGLCLPNTPFYPVAYFGALMAGARVVNFNPLYAAPEIEHQIRDSGTTVMVTLDLARIAPKVGAMLGRTPLRKIVHCDLADALPPFRGCAWRAMQAVKSVAGKSDAVKPPRGEAHAAFGALLANDGVFAPPDIAPGDIAVLQYTGGTTGVPKAAALSHANITANIRQVELWLASGRPPAREKMLAVLPFFHVFSMTVQMGLTMQMGGELIMLPRFEAGAVLKTIHRERPTIFAGVPTLYKALIDAPQARRCDFGALEVCVSGGAALPPPVARGWKDLTGIELVEGYGLSETSPLATANPVFGLKKPGSIGLPVPQTEVKIAHLETGAPCPVGEAGEIRVSGPQVMAGYHENPQATRDAFDEDGFLRTGDVGYMDADGYIFIVDRIKDMINASGLKVFPRKVEEALLEHPAVAEAAVAGVEDDYRGETVKAYIVLQSGQAAGEEELRAFLKQRLAPYEVPTLYAFRDSLPKTLIGKPDKKALKAQERAEREKRQG